MGERHGHVAQDTATEADNEFDHENLGAVDDSSSDGGYHPQQAEGFRESSDDDYPCDGADGIGPSNIDITKGAILSLLFALFIRYRLTKGCLGDLLHLLNLFVPNCVPRTNYFFNQMFFSDTVVTMHFYCPDCQSYLGEPYPINTLVGSADGILRKLLYYCTLNRISFLPALKLS